MQLRGSNLWQTTISFGSSFKFAHKYNWVPGSESSSWNDLVLIPILKLVPKIRLDSNSMFTNWNWNKG